jgi:hypothetical protein
MEHGAKLLRISNCETGNPPEGWESEGQLRNWDMKCGKRLEIRSQGAGVSAQLAGGSPATARGTG